MNIEKYLMRVGHRTPVRPDFESLAALLKSHACSVPFENLDVQLGRPLTTDVAAAYKKIVIDGRGGWCYEQNGVFGWALSQLGFEVTRISANVMRQHKGDASAASHLCLLVTIPDDQDRTCLVDVGFGGSMFEPIDLEESRHEQIPYKLGLKRLDDGHWRFWEDDGGDEFSYDFLAEVADETALQRKCGDLQTNPESGFVLNLVVQQRAPDIHTTLRGRVLKTLTEKGATKRVLQSSDEMLSVLRSGFRLDVPAVGDLWPRIVARHAELFPDKR